MVTVFIHSVRVSLMSHHRVVLLKDADAERYLPIWIIGVLGGTVSHILVAELSDNTYYGRIVMDADGRHMELDARPSDAMALAVRCGVAIYVADNVMAQAGIAASPELETVSPEEAERLSAFRDFVNTLDLDEQEDD